MDKDVLAARQRAYSKGVVGRPVEPDISGDRADPDKFELIGRRQSEKYGYGIIDAGVAVDDDGPRSHAVSSSVSDNRLALPPMATVLTLNVRSTANRCR